MVLEGRLNLRHDNDSYILSNDGRSINLSDRLNHMLLSDVSITVKDMYNDDVLFCESGLFVKERVNKGVYWYHVNGVDLDEVLWNSTGKRLEITITSAV